MLPGKRDFYRCCKAKRSASHVNKEFWQQFQNYAPPSLRVIRTNFARTIHNIYAILNWTDLRVSRSLRSLANYTGQRVIWRDISRGTTVLSRAEGEWKYKVRVKCLHISQWPSVINCLLHTLLAQLNANQVFHRVFQPFQWLRYSKSGN